MTPTLTQQPRCETHRHALLTSEGECPTCTRVAQRAAQSDADEAREQRKLQALARVAAGKPKMRDRAFTW